MRRCAILLVLVCCETHAAFEHLARGSNVVGMGGASVAVLSNPWTAFSNPGALTTLGERTLSLYYSPRPFGLRELSHGSFSFIEPTSVGTFAASGSRFGFDLYREIDLQISYGRPVNDFFTAGVSVHLYHLAIERYGAAQTLGIDVGLLAELTEQVHWGFAAFNVNAPRIGRAREKLPQVFVTGICYSPIPEGSLVADLEKDIRYPVELHFGVEYRLFDLMALRAGSAGDPSILGAGLGIHYSPVQLDYAFTSHSELGATHQFSLSLSLGEL